MFADLGPPRGPLVALLDRLGGLSGRLEVTLVVFGLSWAVSEPSSAVLVASGDSLGPS